MAGDLLTNDTFNLLQTMIFSILFQLCYFTKSVKIVGTYIYLQQTKVLKRQAKTIAINHLFKSNMLIGYLFGNRLLINTENSTFLISMHMLPSLRMFNCLKLSGQKYLPFCPAQKQKKVFPSLFFTLWVLVEKYLEGKKIQCTRMPERNQRILTLVFNSVALQCELEIICCKKVSLVLFNPICFVLQNN